MDHDVSAVFERTKVHRTREGGVHHERQPDLLRQITHWSQVEHSARRIHGRLEKHGARLLAKSLAPSARLERIHQRDVDAECREFVREELVRAAVYPSACEQVIAWPEQGEQR